MTAPLPHRNRVALLRAELKRRRLTGFFVPRADEFQGEYVPAYAERLNWLTNFRGSAGVAIVTLTKAAIFVDGRYVVQVRQQVDEKIFRPFHIVEEPPAAWLAQGWEPPAFPSRPTQSMPSGMTSRPGHQPLSQPSPRNSPAARRLKRSRTSVKPWAMPMRWC
jgi:Xaa-Pro aminopeptidase